MFKILKYTLISFLVITIATAITGLVGIFWSWLRPSNVELPFLKWVIGVSLAQIVGVVIVFAQKSIKYLPEVVTNKTKDETVRFMEDFIFSGSSATIVTNRASWIIGNMKLIEAINEKTSHGAKVEIITPNSLPEEFQQMLSGVRFIVTHETEIPETRFTLVNAYRGGAEKLAIAKGVHPSHEITIFDSNNGPQMIAMAKDIIRKSKRLAND